MKKLFIAAAMTLACTYAKAQSIGNGSSCDIEFAVGCFDPSTCTVTSFGSFTTVTSGNSAPLSACSAPDEMFVYVRFVGSTNPADDIMVATTGTSCWGALGGVVQGGGIHNASATCMAHVEAGAGGGVSVH